MTKKIADKIATLEAKLKQEKATLAAAAARRRAATAKKTRADDTRRKILVGSILLKRVACGAVPQESLEKLVDTELVRDDDRALFGLPPRPKTPEPHTADV